ncbi:MAG TPA: DUF2975 domain-containing protein [Vicinamibacterales bacterium]|nr:DUF2975 domain-containing protein [Vicinamibacterales bacterium]
MILFACRIVAWGSLVCLAAIVGAAIYFAADIQAFGRLAQQGAALPIQWATVEPAQLYALWLSTLIYLTPGAIALWFLSVAFRRFASGAWFDPASSIAFRRFALLLLLQTGLQPIHSAMSSVVLSMNHPPGQKILSITLGTNELKSIGLALIIWVIAELIRRGRSLEEENEAFV